MVWDDRSKWIWIDNVKEDDLYGEFFTTFECNGKFPRICISADSDYTLFLNGKFVNSGQYPDFPHYKIYDELDLSPYCIEGENKLAVVVWYYGKENMSYYPGKASLRFEVHDETGILVCSDEKTLSRKSKAYKNGLKKQISLQLGYSFLYDADAEDGWKDGELNGFGNSSIVNTDLSLYKRPVKKLEIDLIKNSTLIKVSENYYLFDLGEEEVGYLTLKIGSEHRQKLTICYGEHIADGKVRRKIGSRDFSVEVIAKKGVTRYTNYFRRLGARYLELHSEHPVEIEYLSVLPCRYPLNKKEKYFEDTLIQRIYDTSVRTLELCMHDHYEDCPWREQALYAMDSRNQMLCGYYAFDEFDFPRANLSLMSKDNRSDGLLSICTPTNVDLTIPSFSLHYITAVYEYCAYSKDLTLAKEIMPKLESIISVFTDRIKDGLVLSFSSENHWNFYEWSDDLQGNLGKADEPTAEAALNCLLSIALQNIEKICRMIAVEGGYEKIADDLNSNIRKHFFDKKRGLIDNGICTGHFSELVNSLAVLCGAVSGEEAESICEVLANKNDITKVSLSMVCFKYDALIKINKEKYKKYIIDDLKETYGAMLDAGATSFWETEKGESDFHRAGSLCHGWSAMPVYYFNLLLD
ncbi:MAG: family 78 glycoside hydrolase catalytic domain [Clostridia bacterium]|nr:family 78 glycoside hydrolase catalytic domain [Clostridia bacterium]